MHKTLLILSLWSATAYCGEWILTLPEGKTWFTFSNKLRNTVKPFGPDRRFALYRGNRDDLPTALRVQPNYSYQHLGPDPKSAKAWGLHNQGQADGNGQIGSPGKDIGAREAWKVASELRAATVAILDSGIDLHHEDLQKNLWRNPGEIPGNGVDDDSNGYVDDVFGWNFVSNSANVMDENNHGTLVGGILGADAENGIGSRGVAGEISLMTVKCTDRFGVGTTATAIAAIQYAVQNGARILNASWGGSRYDPALYETIRWADSKDAILVAAAGNNGWNHDRGEQIYPAAFRLPNLIAVAAYDNQDMIWSESNFGKESVHIAAPGVSIFGPIINGYGYGTGTSYAAPFVSGTLALLKAYAPKLNHHELIERVLKTSEVIRYYEKERLMTAGRVHLNNALLNIRPVRPEAPDSWTGFSYQFETPHPYPNAWAKTHSIHHPGASYVRVHFSSFETEGDYDVLDLRDSGGNWITSYSGTSGQGWSAEARGDELTLSFKSDYVTAAYGFSIDKYEVSFANKKKAPLWKGAFYPSPFFIMGLILPETTGPIGKGSLILPTG